jgi:Tol biopolymer transport system component
MKQLLAVGLVSLTLLVPAAAVDSARPPALLTFAISYGPNATGAGLCVSRPNGSHRRRLTVRRNYRQPDWAPRGKFLVYQVGAQQFALHVADSRGRLLYQLAHYDGDVEILQSGPAWSPDGAHIAFAGSFRTYDVVAVVTRSGANPRYLDPSPTERISSPTWSPDGTRLAYSKTRSGESAPSIDAIYTMRSDGSDRRLVARPAFDPDWSPNGSKLVYAQATSQGSEIVVANVDGSSPRSLTDSPERESNPAWSPDGKLIAFERTNDQTGRSWIVVVRRDSGAQVSVIRGPYDAHEPAWRPPANLPAAKRGPCR